MSTMQLIYLVCVCLLHSVSGNIRCTSGSVNSSNVSNHSPTKQSIEMVKAPSAERDVEWYVAEVCAPLHPGVFNWQLKLEACDESTRRCVKHSEYTNTFNNTCPEVVCLSVELDLIFAGRYKIVSYILEVGKMPITKADRNFNITDTHFTQDDYERNQINVEVHYNTSRNNTIVTWHAGFRITDYEIRSCSLDDTPCMSERNICTKKDSVTLKCKLLDQCEYCCVFHHVGTWTSGLFSHKASIRSGPKSFCSAAAAAAPVSLRALWAGGAAAGALAALGAAAALALRRRAARQLWDKLRAAWRDSEGAAAAAPGRGDVVLLYAREEARLHDAARELAQLIKGVIGDGQVFDVHCARAAARLGGGWRGWLRGALRPGGARVVLLQTPALYALYNTSGLEPPLISAAARAVPRESDYLLQYALQLLQDAPPDHHYTQYFIVEIEGLRTDVVPTVSPYARYSLPRGAALLLAALGSGPAPPAACLRLERALDQFKNLALAHPAYLKELMQGGNGHAQGGNPALADNTTQLLQDHIIDRRLSTEDDVDDASTVPLTQIS